MIEYTVKVFAYKRIVNIVKWLSVRLIGKNAASDWTKYPGLCNMIFRRDLITLKVECEDLGDLIYIELQKHQLPLTFESQWYVYKVDVTSSNGHNFKFPIYHWLKKTKEYCFSEGKALRPFEEETPPCPIKYTRQDEMHRRGEKYRWTEYKKGLPFYMKEDEKGAPSCKITDDFFRLPSEVQFSYIKTKDFFILAAPGQVKTLWYRFLECVDCCGWLTWKHPWEEFEHIKKALSSHFPQEKACGVSCSKQGQDNEKGMDPKQVAQYIQEHWKEEAFFGYLCLNGVNPIKIRRCNSLPKEFPVTDDMVTLENNMTLSDEMKKGNIFICNYNTLHDAKTGNVDGAEEFLAAPLVLFHKTPKDELKPVAIQLKQTGPEDNPIFLPTDSKHDWSLAKIYARGADFSEHQLNTHLLRTHLLSEVFTVSLLRNTAKVHPLQKLLVPHTRYTLQINLLARKKLINKGGIFETFSATSEDGMITILQRSLSAVTYKSLCIKDDIKDRGMDKVPNYYYRDDGVELWDIIEKFVKGVITFYYKTDDEIIRDTELQDYIKDIFVYGFLSNEESGIPQRFETVDELVKFATMVIFTASAQHAAVNNGQYAYGSWMPNTPTTLVQPPPKAKHQATEDTLLASLPEYKVADYAASVLKLLSTQSNDFRRLGDFPEHHFTEDGPVKLIEEFQAELKEQDKKIKDRNDKLVKEGKLPYEFLMPKYMENSVAI